MSCEDRHEEALADIERIARGNLVPKNVGRRLLWDIGLLEVWCRRMENIHERYRRLLERTGKGKR